MLPKIDNNQAIQRTRMYNFMVFESASSRVNPADVLVKGPQVKEMFEKAWEHTIANQGLKNLILQNRLEKIKQMLELLQTNDHVIVSKFFDKIWRRFSYISNLGEYFLDLGTYATLFPEAEKNIQDLLAVRLHDDDESFEGPGSDKDDVDEEPRVPIKGASDDDDDLVVGDSLDDDLDDDEDSDDDEEKSEKKAGKKTPKKGKTK